MIDCRRGLCYTKTMISKRYSKVIDVYLENFNAQKTGEICGYKKDLARQTVYKILQKPEVKKELERRYNEARISDAELIARIDAMTKGDLPTKIITGSHEREEYDALGAAEKLARIKSLFVDKVDLNISHLNITDE